MFNWRNKSKWTNESKALKNLQSFELYWHLTYFNFCTNTGCISISSFASLIGVSIGITSSAIGLKICARTTGIKHHK